MTNLNVRDLVSNLARGFAMGTADIVPGVSGGTIALILGIYERLLESVRRGARALICLVQGKPSGFIRHLRTVEWSLLIPLLIGVLLAIGALSSIIDRLLEDEPEAMAGLFCGLVAASVVIAWQMIATADAVRIGLAVVVALATFVLLGLQSGTVSNPSALVWFGAGAIAICAMILPGVSGSFLLLMLGMYAAVIDAVHDRDLVPLVIFAVGATIGLALFSTALGWVLDHYRDTLLAALVGLMAGSVRVLWPWPNGVGVIGEDGKSVDGTGLDWPASLSDAWLPLLLAAIAFVGVLGLTRLAPGRSESANAMA